MKNTMKRALSLLVVFAMVCVPMVANAAAGDGVATPPSENCIYSGAVVTVEAGATTYFEISTDGAADTYDFVVEGTGDFDVAVCTEGTGDYAYTEGTPVSAVDGKVETEITSYESTYYYAAFSITNNTDAAVDYTVTVVFPEGTQGNPEAVTLAVDGTAEVAVPAGATYYVNLTLPMMNTEYDLTVSGNTGFGVLSGWGMPTPDTAGSVTLTVSATMWGGGVASVSITNNTESEQVYTLSLANKPAGSSDANPEIITAAGDYTTSFVNGHFYQYTATEAGTLTVTMSDADGWQYQLNGVLADESYYYGDMHWSDDDPVVASESVEVSAGDVYTIAIFPYNTANTTVNWNLAFEAATSEEPAEQHDILVSHVNAYSWGVYNAFVITGEGRNCVNGGQYCQYNCEYWIAIKVDNVDGVYTVTAIEGADGNVKANTCSADGFILYVFGNDEASYAAAGLVEVGDVLLKCDFDWSVDTSSETPIGTMSFGPAATEPTPDPEPEPEPDPESEIISIGQSYTYDAPLYLNGWSAVSTEPDTRLTDGEKAHVKYYDINYVGFTSSYGSTVSLVISLDGTYSVDKFTAYTHSGLDGISAPTSLTISVSADGENWTEVTGTAVINPTPDVTDDWGNTGITLTEYVVTADVAVEAHYIKYTFLSSGNFVILDEIEAYGTLIEKDPEPVEKQDGYDEYATPGALTVGTADYDLDDNYVYTIFALEPSETGKYTITVADGLVGIVSYNGMWVSVAPNDGTITESSIEWECTGVGQAIWVAVTADADPASITVEYEEVTVVTVPEIVYDNTVTPEEFTLDANLEDLLYVDTFDETDDVAVLGEDGYYHLNTADGPVLYVCLNDTLLSLVDANGYGQLKYVEYDEDGNAISKIDYAEAFAEYVACAYTDDAGMMIYPLTADLMVMFQNVGANNGWYGEMGFVGGTLNDAWMFACYYSDAEEAPDYDINADGNFDMYDYMLVKAIYFNMYEPTEEELARADVYADGNIDMYDYMAVKAAYFA